MKALLSLTCATLTLAQGTPVAHWSFDGQTTTARLQESYGRTEFDASEAGGSSSWQERENFGQALANGGALSYLTIANAAAIDPGAGDFSLSLWVRRTSGDGAVAGLIDALAGTGTGFQFFFLNDTLRIRLDDDAGNAVLVDTTSPQFFLNQWIHLCVSVDRQNTLARIHVDGVEATPTGGVSISNLTGSLTPNQDWWVGRLNNDNPAFGQIDDLAIFHRLLTEAELQQLAAGTPVLTLFPPAPPVSVVTFTPSSGILTADTPVTLAGENLDDIRYTLDGTDPDEQSPLYSGPIGITGPTEIRARGFRENTPGPVTSQRFVVVPAEPPNILLIVGDDVGFNDLGCYGAVSVRTPNLDRLATDGLRFTQFTTTGPGDLAAQFSLLTGRVAARASLPPVLAPDQSGLDPREWTLAESLRKDGYDTAFIGSWHLGQLPGSRARDQGFARFLGLPFPLANDPPLVENGAILEESPDPLTLLGQLAGGASQFLAQQSPGNPFFLCFQPPSLPADGDSYLGSHGNRLEALDQAVGQLLTTLEEQDLADHTLVIFLSDSGAERSSGIFPSGSNGVFRDGAGTTWEGGIRTPLIVRWPKTIPGGSQSRALLSLADLFPTLTAICRTYRPESHRFDGLPEPSILLGADPLPRPEKTVATHRHDGTDWALATLRSGPWKLHLDRINSDPENTFSGSPPFLYQVEQDPGERIRREDGEASLLALLSDLVTARQQEVATDQLPPSRPPFLGLPSLILQAGEPLALSFRRPADSLGVSYVLEHSNDLADWQPVARSAYLETTSLLPGETEEVTLRLIAHPSSSALFLRIHFDPLP